MTTRKKEKIVNNINDNYLYNLVYETIFNFKNLEYLDILIEKDDSYIIIDYKLKGIDDEGYDKQLTGYKTAIKEKTSKDVECYLYSIFDSTYRKIK